MDRRPPAAVEDDPLLQRAAEWFVELRSQSASAQRIAEWLQWLEADAAHQRAFDQIASLSRLADHASSPQWPSEDEVAADGYSGQETIGRWRERSSSLTGRTRIFSSAWPHVALRRGVLAASLFFMLVAMISVLYGPTLLVALRGGSRLAVSTEIGETRSITLADGSQVIAGAHTALVAVLLRHSRSVVLDRGEAFFRVAKDRGRPFTVRTGTTAVTAVGTAFDVRHTTTGAVVAVAQGLVRVSAQALALPNRVLVPSQSPPNVPAAASDLLQAGQQWSLDRDDAGPEVAAVDPSSIGSWRDGRLQYIDEPLELIVADLARYSRQRLVLKGEQTAQLRVTGVVFEQDIDAWLASLEVSLPVRVRRDMDGSVVIEHR